MDPAPHPAAVAADRLEASVALCIGAGKVRGQGGFVRYATDQIRLIHELKTEMLPKAVY